MRIRKIIISLLIVIVSLFCNSCAVKKSVANGSVRDTNEHFAAAFDIGSEVVTSCSTTTTSYYNTTRFKATTTITHTTTFYETTKEITNESKITTETYIEEIPNAECQTQIIYDISTETEVIQKTELMQTETTEQTEITESYLDPPIQCTPETARTDIRDALIIGDDVMEIFYGPATQENVDEHDVVQDTSIWSNERSTFFFGHNY